MANRRIVDPLTPAAPFHHLGILTPDIEAAIDFLSPTLGVTFRDPITVASLRVDPDEFGNAAAHPVEGRISFSIEGPPHYELAEGHGSGIHSLERYGAGMHHVGLFASDLAAARTEIEATIPGSLSEIVDGQGGLLAWYSLPSTETGLIVELLDERLRGPIGRYIDLGEAPS